MLNRNELLGLAVTFTANSFFHFDLLTFYPILIIFADNYNY